MITNPLNDTSNQSRINDSMNKDLNITNQTKYTDRVEVKKENTKLPKI